MNRKTKLWVVPALAPTPYINLAHLVPRPPQDNFIKDLGASFQIPEGIITMEQIIKYLVAVGVNPTFDPR